MAKKVLVFDPAKHALIYERCYEAMRWARQNKPEAPGMTVLKSERRIKRALREVGHLDPLKTKDLKCARCDVVVLKGDPEIYILNADGGVVTLEDGDLTMLRDYLAKVAWSGDAGDQAADADDFLGTEAMDEDAFLKGAQESAAGGVVKD